jgi:plastocyanin
MSMTRDTRSRRQFIRATAVTAGAVAVAGCSGGSDSAADDTESSGGDSEPSPTEESTSGAVETSTVEMNDELGYAPKTIQVSIGTEVTWTNVGTIGHTVTAYEDEIPEDATYFASGGYDSEQAAKDGYSDGQGGNVPEGESFSHTFETTGTYEYYCIPHEMNGMVGTVEVR